MTPNRGHYEQALFSWLKKSGIDPEEPCHGKPARLALAEKLSCDFECGTSIFEEEGNLVDHTTGNVLLYAQDARPFLWGKPITLVVGVPENEEYCEEE